LPFTYAYPRPSVTCDVVVFTLRADDLSVLLIRRKDNPFKGKWALPGGFVNENEPLDRAALRELEEETGIGSARVEQLGAYGDPGRDPRGHTVTVAWLTFFGTEPRVTAGDDAAAAEWHPFRALALDGKSEGKRVQVAFDHAKILANAYARLCQHLDNPLKDRPFELVPPRFTLAQLRHVYTAILGQDVPTRAFKKRLVGGGLVVPASTRPTTAKAPLYRWATRK
jgi:8-oxo-dGTP diphosphatase